jgi:hypothetical protein
MRFSQSSQNVMRLSNFSCVSLPVSGLGGWRFQPDRDYVLEDDNGVAAMPIELSRNESA